MKNICGKLISLSLFLLIAIMVFPSSTSAQYSGRGYSSSLRRKINELADRKMVNVPVPILFGVTPDNITSDFGDPRSGGRQHEGQDIMAPKGAPIVTPTEAVVLRTDTGDSAGKYVYTANPGRETFAYMHLNEIADIDEGDVLKKGDLIGYVGNTGNASSGVPHLHFEIHNDDGDPMNPYPRLTRIFPLADKIKYLESILKDADDEEELAEFLVKMYRSELVLARTLGIILPPEIINALEIVPVSLSPLPAYVPQALNIPVGDLSLGSRGLDVVALQNFLISKNAGFYNGVVADGVFGLVTQRALIDYQTDVGIKPALGYYGAITRAYIVAHP
ncbi:hypothetical protein A3A95_03025 [Candidatus Nomurabacteria bacterium RIFCSPLOWO2_01_FULL_39_18]|uniref:Uncharacterized protein n=1 Tax=Candidatus Nomurabacteria bacterium RIFCSPHIGHO2_01_FULL_40_24b TaxID=1801739 RepID=A0A1F6V7A2_9BACT|nr:MAG: hypothetical protein A2647_03540 [Candidatus Nomurabacteria bacterium RIFCSPHIGHO2_01_FULL_40_24b]OGI89630.1 MAG: hypothetical protein A3A95_03025 [Candidatus Nomurabacteria bacterium RIFCSPLOWO2_01_FULL_39_18]